MAAMARSSASLYTKGGIVAIALVSLASCGGGGGGPDGSGGSGGGGGGDVRTLTFPAGVRGGSPRFSPDGTLLAHARDTGALSELALMSPTGADSRSITNDGDYLLAMAWTADGSAIIYGSSDTGIRAVSPSGGANRFVVDAFAVLNPDLSPDGRWLAYGLNGSTLHLADLSQTPPVVSDLGLYGDSPRFSPDGATRALWSDDKIQLMDLASRTLTDVIASTNSFGRVAWFADGTRLVAGTERGIEIVTLAPPVQRRLILDSFAVLDVDLSPDGASVAYGVNGHPELYVLTGF
jgi:Tol biopolymer transport system component